MDFMISAWKKGGWLERSDIEDGGNGAESTGW